MPGPGSPSPQRTVEAAARPPVRGVEHPLVQMLPPEWIDRAGALADRAFGRAIERAQEWEFGTWRCGCRLPAGLADAGPEVGWGFRALVRHEVMHRLEQAWPTRVHTLHRPELVLEIRPDWDEIFLVVAPLFVAGRYRKLVRGISQTIFHCRVCRGRRKKRERCAACAGTGRLFPEAAEDFVAGALKDALDGRRTSFHGSGREDVDVRMLGEGRPFVVKVSEPHRRAFDPDALSADVAARSGGRVTVSDLRAVPRDTMSRLTADHGMKTYRVVVVPAEGSVLPHDVGARLAALEGAEISQRTPVRVSDRRADMVRSRAVHGVEVVEAAQRRVELVVRTDPGTYVKELVSGDDGRTEPSLASVLGVPCTCTELDVLSVGSTG